MMGGGLNTIMRRSDTDKYGNMDELGLSAYGSGGLKTNRRRLGTDKY